MPGRSDKQCPWFGSRPVQICADSLPGCSCRFDEVSTVMPPEAQPIEERVMRIKRAPHKGSSSVLLAATGIIVVGLVVPVVGRALPAGVTSPAPTVFVANNLSGTVSAIDTATDAVVATIPVGTRPTEVAVTPDGTTAYVANFDSGTVSAIDTATDTVTATFTVGTQPQGIAISPDGATAYVAERKATTRLARSIPPQTPWSPPSAWETVPLASPSAPMARPLT